MYGRALTDFYRWPNHPATRIWRYLLDMLAQMKLSLVGIRGREQAKRWRQQTGGEMAASLSGVRCMKLALNLTVRGFN